MTAPVGPPTPRQQAWAALGAELTPAKSLQRLDAATARVVSTVGTVGTLLTGLGLIAAGLPNLPDAARALAVTSVVLAFLAVLAALAAQTVTITRGLNTTNLREVEDWYHRRFELRAPLTRAASVLLVLAAAAAGVAAVITLVGDHPEPPTLAVTRTTNPTAPAGSTLTVDVTFRGLDAGQVATTTVTVDGTVVAVAAFSPGPDGTATRTLTVEHMSTGGPVVVDARAGNATCSATLTPGQPPALTCLASP